jgi:transcriptional regulator with XRE-family HTH domain
MTIGDRIKRERTGKGWGVREFARRAGVRATLVSQLENGKLQDTTGRNLARMARTLGVSMDYLYGLYGEEQSTHSEHRAVE